ncbi:MAG: hypothetical protein O2946_11945 [Planctomycetota bacterium]|jgi:hypothetical protein|nr:hypothetical protein [Planctomycetota bacterium]
MQQQQGITRRGFTGTLLSSAVAAATGRSAGAWANSRRPRIAFLGTVVFQHSHAQHFLDRFAMGQSWRGQWEAPRLDVAGIFLDQVRDDDLGKARIKKYGLASYPTIEETLTLGGEKLAVDGVVIIGEHGDYPQTAKGQTRYPRYEWFKKVVDVFEDSGRSVPVFNDKHLSTDWAECQEMVDDSRRLSFPFYAGSSLPVTWRLPSIDMPFDVPLSESVCVAYGGIDSYDFHALETAQCMSERRRGGEVGIRSVLTLSGEAMYEHLATRETTAKLFVSALCRSHNLPVDGGYPSAPVSLAWARDMLPSTTGSFIEHRDGFHTAIFLTGIQDFNYAGMRADTGEIVSCQMMLPMPGHGASTADFFNPLSRHVEDMVLTGETTYPIDRTLLTSGMVIGGVDSIAAGNTRVETPQMEVRYQGPRESMYWRT